MEQIKRINRTLVKKGVIIDYYKDTMQIPNGNVAEWDFIDHKGAAAIVAVLEDGRIALVRQYRNALERETLELPAGGLNRDAEGNPEPMQIAAIRELEEETGFIADGPVDYLTTIYTTVAFCNERIGIYIATGLKNRGKQHLDEDEYVDVVYLTLEECKEKILSGQIQDSKTIVGILGYATKYGL